MRHWVILFLVGLLPVSIFAETLQLDGPVSGWRDSRQNQEVDQFRAAYPKPPVDRGGQRFRTLIEGRIGNSDTKKAHTLIVNGVPMRLYTGSDGYFSRPWAFGPGANNVEVRTADGLSTKRVQFYEADPNRPRAKLRAILSWDDPSAEIDLHVISPAGEHAFWASPLMASGGGLDVDSVDGAGPEIFSTIAPLPGTWMFYINYWGNFNAAGYNFEAEAHEQTVITCTLTLVRNENSPNELRETFIVPMRAIGDLVLARTLRF